VHRNYRLQFSLISKDFITIKDLILILACLHQTNLKTYTLCMAFLIPNLLFILNICVPFLDYSPSAVLPYKLKHKNKKELAKQCIPEIIKSATLFDFSLICFCQIPNQSQTHCPILYPKHAPQPKPTIPPVNANSIARTLPAS
jgi:hypothetical protein